MLSPWYGGERWSELFVILPRLRSVVRKARRGTCSHDPVQAVSRITESGHDVAVFVELLVDRAGDDPDRHVEVGGVRLKPRDAFGGREQGDRGDVGGAQVDQITDGHGERAAGREHRVEHIALTPG